jgi:hypothetical protein
VSFVQNQTQNLSYFKILDSTVTESSPPSTVNTLHTKVHTATAQDSKMILVNNTLNSRRKKSFGKSPFRHKLYKYMNYERPSTSTESIGK